MKDAAPEIARYYDLFSNDSDLQGEDIFDGFDRVEDMVSKSKEKGHYPFHRKLLGPSRKDAIIEDQSSAKKMIMMASNNYLDLASDPRVVNAAAKALQEYGLGTGSVSMLAGTNQLHAQLSQEIAQFYNREDCVIFPTGYSANVGTISALTKPNDLILCDMFAHTSIKDGIKLSGATCKTFIHNDMNHLHKLLSKMRNDYKGVLITVDGTYSMDGDLCPLPQLIELKEKFNARLLVDEAHSIGMIGANGRGIEEHYNMPGSIDIIVGTFSKAPGALGGYTTGSKLLVQYLKHMANAYIFSTSLPPSVTGGLIESFRIIREDAPLRQKLQDNIKYFSNRLKENNFNIGNSCTAIIPVILGHEIVVKEIVMELHRRGIFVSAVTYPAVSKKQSRIRISIMATHSQQELDLVCDSLIELRQKYSQELG